MKIVVYESLWGNTAAVASAIAAGLGDGAQALRTSEATAEVVARAELIVAGGPVFAFQLSSDRSRADIGAHPALGMPEPDLSGPSLRAWLDALPAGSAKCAAFDTQVRGPFGKGAPTIAQAMQAKGYQLIASPEGFMVAGKYGPLRPGELDRARQWGDSLRRSLAGSA